MIHQPVADLLRNGGVIIYIAPQAPVSEAVQKMARHNVGAILVLEHSSELVGIFTERDLLSRVVASRRDPETTLIRDVMTADVISVNGDTPRYEVLQIMNQQHCRHIPVIEKERLLGVISLRDLLRFDIREKDFEIEQLREYILQAPVTATPTQPAS